MYAVYYWMYSDPSPVKRLIYAPNSGDDGYSITSGKFDHGMNMAGSLTIVVPPTNPAWGDNNSGAPNVLGPYVIISVEYVDGDFGRELWRGRVITQTWDIYQNMTITCEGILAYLNDILIPAYNFSWDGVLSQEYNPDDGLKFANLDLLKDFLSDLTTDGIEEAVTNVVENVVSNDAFSPDVNEIYDTITKGLPVPTVLEDGTIQEDHTDRRVSVYDYLLFIMTLYNSELSQSRPDLLKQLRIGYIDPIYKKDEYLINHKEDRYTNVWDAISSNVIDVYGGVMILSNWYKDPNGIEIYDPEHSYLYYYKDYSGESRQVVQYGENLVNFEIETDHTERVSRWYVFGSVKDANGKETEVDMSSVNNGLKYVGSDFLGTVSKVEYTELTTPTDCYNRAMQLLRNSFFAEMTTTINAVDMHLVDSSIELFEPGEKIKVIMTNKAYSGTGSGTEYVFRLESMSVNILSPEESEYVLRRSEVTA